MDKGAAQTDFDNYAYVVQISTTSRYWRKRIEEECRQQHRVLPTCERCPHARFREATTPIWIASQILDIQQAKAVGSLLIMAERVACGAPETNDCSLVVIPSFLFVTLGVDLDL